MGHRAQESCLLWVECVSHGDGGFGSNSEKLVGMWMCGALGG